MGLNNIKINNTTNVKTGVVYDISKATDRTYDTLADALGTDGRNVPLEVREGGMSVRYVLNSDNKYVQYRLMADEWSTTVSDWQGVDDEPTPNSHNLPESNGVIKAINQIAYQPSSDVESADLKWEQKTITSYVASASSNRCIALVPVSNVFHMRVVPAEGWYINVWFYSKGTSSDNLDANIGITSSGSVAETIEMDMPDGCEMIALWCRKSDQSNFDKSVAYQAFSSIEFVTDKDKIVYLEGKVATLPNYIEVYPTAIRRQNYQTLLPDANDAKLNTLYFVYTNQGTKPEHFPNDYTADGFLYYLKTVKSVIDSDSDYIFQTLEKSDNSEYYYRTCLAGAWSDWISSEKPLSVFPTAIRRQNYQSLLPDANNAELGVIYMIYTNQGTKPENFPSQYSADGFLYYLTTIVSEIESGVKYIYQTLQRSDGTEYYYRANTGGGWDAWSSKFDKATILVGDGQQFTTIKAALEYANSIGNLNIKVLDGTYDIIEEYGGQAALETAVAGGDYGLLLGRGNTIEFSTKAFVTCLYNGSNSLVMERFSPFNASTLENVTKIGFTIIGLNIDCKNVRYCVHDESAGTAKYRHHKYINCTMHIDNSQSQYASTYVACIGGGLGKQCRIDVIGGYYKSETADATRGAISYHNASGSGATADAKSEINVDGVYFDGNGSVSFGYYGASTLITNCYVRNCSMSAAPNVHAETESSTIVNMQLKAWNNEIRS